jgi:superkiller protein 3
MFRLVILAAIFLAAATAQRTGKLQVQVQKSGKVTMEDGSPPPEPVVIEALCGAAAAVPVARSDSKGGFIIGHGRDADVDARMQRGSASSAGGRNLAGCALQARLPGYRSSRLRVADSEAIDLGVIVIRRAAGEGVAESATSQQASKDARRAFEKGTAAIGKKKWDEARTNLEKAVELYPEYAAAWFELGRASYGAGDFSRARGAYERATKADPKFVPPYIQLATVLQREKNWQAAADVSAAAIKLDPDSYPAAWVINAVTNFRLGNMSVAEAAARKAIKLEAAPQFPEIEYALGMVLAERNEFKEAAGHLRSYLRLAPNSPGADTVQARIDEFESRQPAAR